jgi:hypothetical protein
MSNIFGNRGGGGGFANPATTNLDMNNLFKIIGLANGTDPKDAVNLSQLTTYNPFNQSLNTTDNVQFQNVNMNGGWQIPNSQPSSPNDFNTYALSSRGGLLNITTNGANPDGQLHIRLGLAPPTYVAVDIPIPSGYISTLDLCDYIQNYFNALNLGGSPGIVVCTQCRFVLNYFNIIITNSQANNGYWGQIFTLMGGTPGSVSELMGIVVDDTKIYTQTAVGTVAVNRIAVVGWFSSNSAYPIQNGSPYIYSTAQDKWYCSDNLYTPDFLSYMDFNNTSYNLFQNGSNRLKINSTEAFIYSPNAVNYIAVNDFGLSYTQGGVVRLRSVAGSTNLLAANGITNCSVSNNGVGLTVDTLPRFSALSAGDTTIKSFDDTMAVVLASNSFSASTSTNNKLILTNSGLVYAHNNIQKMIMNANNFLISNGATNRLDISGTNSIISAPTGLNRLYLDDTLMKYDEGAQNRLIIDTGKSQLFSPGGGYSVFVGTPGVSLVAGGTARLGISSFQSYSYSPDYFSSSAITNTDITMLQAGFTKFLMNEDPLIGTTLSGPSGSGRIELINARITLRQNSVNRFVINNAETYSFAPSLLNYSYKSDTELANFFNSVNRFSIGATSCVLSSPSSTNYITVNDTEFIYTQGGVGRIRSSASSTYLLASNSTTLCSVSTSGASLTVDTLARFTALSGGNTTIKSFDNTTSATLAGDNFTVATTTNSLVVNADFTYYKGAQMRIHADSSHSQLLSPNGLQAVEANNTGVQINLGTDNYKLPTTRGTSGQVLTYSGINTTWASPGASNNAGFSLFSPLESTGTIGSGNKPYWYICMVPCNTVLTGFKTVLSTGSDPFHVGIYRGRTPNNAATILDLLSPITTPAGAGYYSNAFVLQAGRSNVYAAGEYITIMYHSQGSTNVFYNFIGISDTAIAYTSSANYGNSAPPANLGSVPVLGTIANRLAIEFY